MLLREDLSVDEVVSHAVKKDLLVFRRPLHGAYVLRDAGHRHLSTQRLFGDEKWQGEAVFV